MRNYLCVALLGACAELVLGSTAYAQSATIGDTDLVEITVTGSRVIQNGNNSPTPVTVISPDKLFELQPTTLADIVNLIPALQGSLGTGTAASSGTRDGAASYLDLRDLGYNRTLVLYDGHRLAGNTATQTSNVDITVIPQLLLERVDVVTGGASAVYGTDAVAGVVNFITDTHFTGVKVQASSGISTYSDDNIADFGIAAGENLFDGRGHVEASFQFHDDPGIMSRSARPFFAQDTGGAGSGTAASPYHNVPNEVFGNTSFGGLIAGGPLAGYQFAQNGIVSPFVHGAPTGTSNIESGGDGGYYENSSIKSSEIFNQFFARLDYKFSDAVHSYVQTALTTVHSWDNYQDPNLKIKIGYNNPFLDSIQQPYQAQLAAQEALTPAGSFSFNRLVLDNPRTDDITRTAIAMAGLDGTIGKYHWNFALDYDRNEVSPADIYNVNEGNMLAAANVVVNPATGQPVCNASLSNPRYANCVPLNLFGPTAQSAAAMNYILQKTQDVSVNTLYDVSGSFTGAPFNTWAGPANMALSAEWHRNTWIDTNNANPNELADCTGIQFGCTQGSTPLWLQGTNFPTALLAGHPLLMQNVAEVAYETDVPLLKDQPFARSLNFDGAVRYAKYDNLAGGNVVAWKTGLDWHVNDVLTVRATRSRDVRAPTLNELYGQDTPGTPTPSPATDLHTGGSGLVPIFQINNPNLKPELADTVTAGVIIQPVPSFSMSFDYFHTTVHDVIFSLSGQSGTVQAACEASNGTSSLCNLFARPLPFSNHTAANFPTALYAELLNIASLQTSGVDAEANYAATVFEHALTLRGLVSYQPHLLYNEGPAGSFDLGDTATGVSLYPASPSVKYTIIGSYDLTQNFNISVMEKGRNSMKVSAVPTFVFAQNRDPAIQYTNLTLSYTPNTSVGKLKVFLNVANLFNAYPTVYYPGAFPAPGTGNVNPSYLPTDDDPVGRYFTLGVRYRF